MDINLTLTIEAGDVLRALLEPLAEAANAVREANRAYLATLDAPAGNAGGVVAEPQTAAVVEPAAAAASAAPVDDLPFQTAEPVYVPVPEKYGKDYLLGVMKATRRRLLGDDYETNADAKVVALGKQLTAEFKTIARTLGASFGLEGVEKPSDLPMDQRREAFANSLDELYLEDGQIKVKAPF